MMLDSALSLGLFAVVSAGASSPNQPVAYGLVTLISVSLPGGVALLPSLSLYLGTRSCLHGSSQQLPMLSLSTPHA